jgi:hypothetical protein
MRTFIQSANQLRFGCCDRDLSSGGEGVTGTHIIWRNPSPPRKREILVSRVARNHAAAVYQVITPAGSKRLFQLFRSGTTTAAAAAAAVREAATAMASPGAGLVSARW